MPINFFFNDVIIALPQRRRLKTYLNELFKKEKYRLDSLNYIFCSDRYLLQINNEFLQHDDYTDVITFTLNNPGEPVIGEIYISAERIRENASRLNIPIQQEIHRVIFHGALHLCGYNDKTVNEKDFMTVKEDEYLDKYLS